MRWYTTECLFRSVLDGGRKRAQHLERRCFLLRATNEQSATKKAQDLARKKQHSYLNSDGEKVEWVLEKVVDTKEIFDKRLVEGTEVFHEYVGRRAGKVRRRT